MLDRDEWSSDLVRVDAADGVMHANAEVVELQPKESKRVESASKKAKTPAQVSVCKKRSAVCCRCRMENREEECSCTRKERPRKQGPCRL